MLARQATQFGGMGSLIFELLKSLKIRALCPFLAT